MTKYIIDNSILTSENLLNKVLDLYNNGENELFLSFYMLRELQAFLKTRESKSIVFAPLRKLLKSIGNLEKLNSCSFPDTTLYLGSLDIKGKEIPIYILDSHNIDEPLLDKYQIEVAKLNPELTLVAADIGLKYIGANVGVEVNIID